MAAHTPAPWVVEPVPKDNDPEFDFSDAPFWIADTHTGEVLALVHNTAGDEAFANAVVMAKGPELLACCKELRGALLAAIHVITTRADPAAADAYVDDLTKLGFAPGIIGQRADGVIAEAEGRPRSSAMESDHEQHVEPDPRD